jgi:pantoate--beta-alanine ligase
LHIAAAARYALAMLVHDTIAELRRVRDAAPGTVGFVPTMGALHAGHLALVRAARKQCDTVFVSIFVNPTQFGPGEDYQHYPRTLEVDLEACRREGVDHVFTPSVDTMYPPDVPDAAIDVPDLTADLEGHHRPGHFPGVCRVVAKLLNIARPDVAYFGQKDYQQLKVIEALTRDLALPARIEPVPTVRESDGLALSSRNQYLTADQRPHALGLAKALQQARHLIEREGETDPAAVEQAMRDTLLAHHLSVDYATVRHPHTLRPLDIIEPALTDGVVALIAARLGEVRLIDNAILGRPADTTDR